MRKILQYLLILCGCGFLLYSPITNYLEEQRVQKLLDDMDSYIQQIDIEDYAEIKEKAVEYNNQLWGRYSGTYTNSQENLLNDYDNILNLDGDGLIGKVEVPSVDINLPIYHGEDERTLATSSGHHEGSALPIGTTNSRAVLSAHTGLATPKLFTRVDELEKGDLFFINVLDETYAYEVWDIEVILPTEVEKLNPIEGEDLVTLLTCTPYGINSHRLLVTGKRVYLTDDEIEEARKETSTKLSWHELVFYVLPAIIVLLIFLFFIYKALRKRKKKGKKDFNSIGFENLPDLPDGSSRANKANNLGSGKKAKKKRKNTRKAISKEVADEKATVDNLIGGSDSLPSLPEH